MKAFIRRAAPAILFVCCLSSPASSATPEEIERLSGLIGVDELIEIVRDEGMVQAEELRESMFPDASVARWGGVQAKIYDPLRLSDTFGKVFAGELAEAEIAPLLEFFESEAGRQVIRLEIDARQAIMEPDVEQVAREVYLERAVEGGPRLDLLDRFVEANDLIEYNVMGAMNASLAFYRGLSDGGALEMTESDMLREVWGQEQEIRHDSSEWLYGYMLMAYEPLGDGELQAYIDMSGSDQGRVLNRALFAGFDAMFDEVSYALGRAAAGFMAGDDI